MTKKPDPIQQLEDIRKMMQHSVRFISLSGLSGIAAGLSAMGGATAVYWYLGRSPFANVPYFAGYAPANQPINMQPSLFFPLVASIVLVIAIASSLFFTRRQARRLKQPVWSPIARRILINLSIPLATGGIFLLALYRAELYAWLAPSTLIFYGCALLQAGKYTLRDIQYLGITEIILGLAASFWLGYGLEFWTVGFGICHILYGGWMWFTYERSTAKTSM